MKIRLWSDIHLEFGPLHYAHLPTDKDTVLVIAGDFQVGVGGEDMDNLERICEHFKAVVYTSGNHEVYHQVYEDVMEAFAAFADAHENFYFLQPGCVIIDGVRFIGGTFWTDLKNANPIICNTVRSGMNDFRQIKVRFPESGPGGRPTRDWAPEDVIRINQEQREFFEAELAKPFDGTTIIVTHHAPLMICARANAARYDNSVMDYAYCNSDLESWFVGPDAKNFQYWFHGHIHAWQEHEVGGKKIIARPRGYIRYEQCAEVYDQNHLDAEVIEV